MCMQCVAQGAPYVLGSVVGLRVMATRAHRRRPLERAVSAAVAAPADEIEPVMVDAEA